MTDSALTRTPALMMLRTGAGLATLVALVDLAGLFAFGIGTAPIAVVVTTGLLGAATLIGAVFAWQRRAWGMWLAIVTRALSALGAIPVLFVPEAPKDAIPLALVLLFLTVIAIVLLAVGLRARRR